MRVNRTCFLFTNHSRSPPTHRNRTPPRKPTPHPSATPQRTRGQHTDRTQHLHQPCPPSHHSALCCDPLVTMCEWCVKLRGAKNPLRPRRPPTPHPLFVVWCVVSRADRLASSRPFHWPRTCTDVVAKPHHNYLLHLPSQWVCGGWYVCGLRGRAPCLASCRPRQILLEPASQSD